MRLLFIITILSSFVGFSQADLLNTKNSADISNNSVSPDNQVTKPLDYPTVNDNDIIFSFTVWEVIDLAQRVNFPYLYPINESFVTPDRKPLFWHLINGIRENKFKSKCVKIILGHSPILQNYSWNQLFILEDNFLL